MLATCMTIKERGIGHRPRQRRLRQRRPQARQALQTMGLNKGNRALVRPAAQAPVGSTNDDREYQCKAYGDAKPQPRLLIPDFK